MKNILCGILVFLGAAVFCGAEGIAEEAVKGNERAEMSYAFGMVMASDIVGTGLDFNYDSFIRGFRTVLEKGQTPYTMDEAMKKIQIAYAAAQAEIAEHNRVEGAAFLEENGKRPGVITTPSGLQYEIISEGSGKKPGLADSVRVHYHGTLIDNTVFDSTLESGEPAVFPLDRVIPGWSEGLRMMNEGSKAKLYIPPNLAYGAERDGPISPNSVLVFEVELLEIIPPPPPREENAENQTDDSGGPVEN